MLGQVIVWFDAGSSVRERQERFCDKKQCLVWYVKRILASERERGREGRRESKRPVVSTNGYRICGLFPHIILNLTIPHR